MGARAHAHVCVCVCVRVKYATQRTILPETENGCIVFAPVCVCTSQMCVCVCVCVCARVCVCVCVLHASARCTLPIVVWRSELTCQCCQSR